MDRKLVTIRQVTDIRAIPDADRIEVAQIDGWQCVVARGQFKSGDCAVFFEIDSLLPMSDARFSFLAKDAKTHNNVWSVKLKTHKFKKTLSQGLLMPLSDFPELKTYTVGDDVSKVLGIVKGEPPMTILKTADGIGHKSYPFPSFIPKTDEERVQNIPHILENEKNAIFEVTEKLDGTSMTVFYHPDHGFGVCSRNLWLKKPKPNLLDKLGEMWTMVRRGHYQLWRPFTRVIPENFYWQIAKQHELDKVLPKLDKAYALQGEIIGEGIQRNHYKFVRPGPASSIPYRPHHFLVFNIYDINNKRYLTPDARKQLLTTRFVDLVYSNSIALTKNYVMGVPNLGTIRLSDFKSMNQLIAFADGPSAINKNVIREGIVLKRMDGKFSFKIVSNKFLLKTEE